MCVARLALAHLAAQPTLQSEPDFLTWERKEEEEDDGEIDGHVKDNATLEFVLKTEVSWGHWKETACPWCCCVPLWPCAPVCVSLSAFSSLGI